MPRKNGFERPFATHQIIAWVAFTFFLLFFYILYTPVHTTTSGIVLSIIYTLLVGAVAFNTYMTTSIDPSDAGVLAKNNEKQAKTNGNTGSNSLETNYCYLCEANVAKRSKHCRR
eukprot:6174641-Pleurochrysis_carterae.AAC.2